MLYKTITFGLTYYAYLMPLLLLETWYLGVKNSFFYRLFILRDRSTQVDFFISAAFVFGCSHFFQNLFTFGLSDWFHHFHLGGNRMNVYSSIKIHFFVWMLYFILIDFSDYWVHRLMHEWTPLWKMHAYHHSATTFNILTGNRVHFFEKALYGIGRSVVLCPFLFDLKGIFFVVLARRIIDQLQHSDLPWTYGWLGRHIFISPMQHKIHHSSKEEHFDKNYGNIFVFWDKWFDTYIEAKKGDIYPLGTSDKKFDQEVNTRPIAMIMILWCQFFITIAELTLKKLTHDDEKVHIES